MNVPPANPPAGPPRPPTPPTLSGPLILGIDLGLTYARCTYLGPSGPVLVRNDRGESATPAMVGLDRQGQIRIGELARAQLPFAPERTVVGVKRLMGTQNMVLLAERRYSPTEICGAILRRLREDAERITGTKASAAAIAVPAYYTDAQRKAIRDAAALASLNTVALCSEPMAIALAYDLWELPKGQRALIFDLGAAALDVSIIEGGTEGPRLIAAAGQAKLGGEDIDRRLLTYFLELFERSYGFSLADDPQSLLRLRLAAEKAKRDLSERETVTVSVPNLGAPGGTPLALETELSREQLELLAEDALQKTLEQVDIALRDARMEAADIEAVMLAGGGAQVPMVRRLLSERLGKAPRGGVAPAEAAVRGVTLYAARLGLGQSQGGRGAAGYGRGALSASGGARGEGLAPRAQEPGGSSAGGGLPPMPTDLALLTGRGPQGGSGAMDDAAAEGFNALALNTRDRRQQVGAAQARRNEPITCPVTLGIEVVGQSGGRRMAGVFSPLLRRGEMAPAARTVEFHTTVANQQVMDIRIYEGEGRLVRDNHALGVLTVRDIPAGPAGSERIAVTFLCDERGSLSVRARVRSTGVDETLHIEALPSAPQRAGGAAAVDRESRFGSAAVDRERGLGAAAVDRERGLGSAVVDRLASRQSERLREEAPRGPAGLERPRAFREDTGPEMDPVALRALLQMAEQRAADASPQARAKLLYLARRLREAVVVGDRADVARLSEALERALFALD